MLLTLVVEIYSYFSSTVELATINTTVKSLHITNVNLKVGMIIVGDFRAY